MNAQEDSRFAGSGGDPFVQRSQPVCKECGSPLSAASKFCWRCGANRDGENDSRADLHRGNSTPVGRNLPRVEVNGPVGPSATSEAYRQSGVQPYWPHFDQDPFSRPKAPAPEYNPSAGGQQIFDFNYRLEAEPDSVSQEPKSQSVYRTVAILLLAVLIVVLAYWQRNNAKTFYAMLKSAAVENLWQDEAHVGARHEQPSASNETHIRSRVRSRASRSSALPTALPATKIISVARHDSLPLGVRVHGQSAPRSAPMSGTDAMYNDHGAVEVGISDPWITGARLSPMAIQISPRESLALLIKRVPPIYPEQARAANVQGPVVLKVVIRRDGTVNGIMAVSGDPMLVPAAVDCVRQWMYRPYYRYGVPMDVETIVVVDFASAAQVTATLPQ